MVIGYAIFEDSIFSPLSFPSSPPPLSSSSVSYTLFFLPLVLLICLLFFLLFFHHIRLYSSDSISLSPTLSPPILFHLSFSFSSIYFLLSISSSYSPFASTRFSSP